ncbi:kinase-like domain-containing protein [Dactylonectria estremocensis]|uniref:EKC/KEOPS complex subunit BUD32 n=1 Tax=Dactylonectria estremocensis TaxID=1079267 RepID=A0A9P9DJS6_9HYPO|nr:kinase-like domain-containing protein [Dactylonectria estremocensis]
MAPIIPESDSNQQYYDMSTSQRLGRGRYSTVFECRDSDGQRFAVKLFRDRSQENIEHEIGILKHLRGGPNIIAFIDSVQGFQGSGFGIVLELVDHVDFRTLFPRFGDFDIRYYTRELLRALQFSHSRGVMHRDVRPHNVLIDHEHRKLRLVGWGSSGVHRAGQAHTLRVSVWRPPELLLGFERYDYSLDMWQLGSMLASMVFRKEPFFHGNSRLDQLVKIARVLGTDRLYAYVSKHNMDLDGEDIEALGNLPCQPFTIFVNSDNERLVTDEAMDLLQRLLLFDHEDRLTAREALAHTYYQALG